jgi:hypothetical protein
VKNLLLLAVFVSVASLATAGEGDPKNYLDMKSQSHEVIRESREERAAIHRRFKAKKLEARAKSLRAANAAK